MTKPTHIDISIAELAEVSGAAAADPWSTLTNQQAHCIFPPNPNSLDEPSSAVANRVVDCQARGVLSKDKALDLLR
jgi:hypothetical protein